MKQLKLVKNKVRTPNLTSFSKKYHQFFDQISLRGFWSDWEH